jgi:DNA topoisomerase VI subunit A
MVNKRRIVIHNDTRKGTKHITAQVYSIGGYREVDNAKKFRTLNAAKKWAKSYPNVNKIEKTTFSGKHRVTRSILYSKKSKKRRESGFGGFGYW